MLFIPPDETPPANLLQQLSTDGGAGSANGFDVVAVGAHPDDTDVACGGTLAALAAQGYRVAMVDLTDGEPTPNSTGPLQRLEESRLAGETLGVAYRRIMNLPNRRLMDSFETRIALAQELRLLRPRIVIGFGSKTPLASPDHYQAVQITDAAIFYCRLSKWDEHFAGLPPFVIQRQLYFRIPLEPMTPQSTDAQITMDISNHMETKLAAIRCFKSQFAKRPHVIDRLRAAAILAGASAGYEAGETFFSPRPIGTQDLVQSLLADGSQAAALQSLFVDSQPPRNIE